MKIEGGKQSTLRYMNRELILNVLSKQSMSNSDLAKKINLSNTGVNTIIDEMMQEGLLCKTEAPIVSVGRRPILLNINPRCGIVCVVKFDSSSFFGVYSVNGDKLFEYYYGDRKKFTAEDINIFINRIRDTLKNEFSDYRLLHICISVPGKVEKNTGAFVYSPFFENYAGLNLKKCFEDEFGVSVSIKNDIRFALLAEKSNGPYRDAINNTLYLQLGIGIGCAMFFDGKLYEGSRGLNGEIGFFRVDCLHSAYKMEDVDKKDHFYQVCSNDNITKTIQKAIKQGAPCSIQKEADDITIGDITEAYRAGDFLCNEVVDATARITADVLLSMFEVLDFDLVLISKTTIPFGQKYIDAISGYMNFGKEADRIQVVFSGLGRESVILGAKNHAIKRAIKILARS